MSARDGAQCVFCISFLCRILFKNQISSIWRGKTHPVTNVSPSRTPTAVRRKLLWAIKEHLFTNWFYSQKSHTCLWIFKEINLKNVFFLFPPKVLLFFHSWMTAHVKHADECEVLVLLFSWKHAWVDSRRWNWAVLRKPLIRIRVKSCSY